MGPTRPDRIPLFPLNVVLLPGADLPLHIFEPRYRRMVRECLEKKFEFGMLLSLPNGVVRVGCTAEILEVAKNYADGRMDIVTIGRAPFRVVELLTGDPFLEGIVDYLDDGDSPSDARRERELNDLYEACFTLVYAEYPKELQGSMNCPLSYRIANALPMDLLWKQQLLELRTEAERQERLAAYLREWAPHLQKAEALRHRAEGNGHGLN